MARKQQPTDEPDKVIERLREFRSAEPDRLKAFLDSLPAERVSGITPIGYEYREYKNWRGIPGPRRCPFCKQAKGEIRKVRGGFQGVCPNCGAPFELFHLSISPPNSVAAALSERWCRVDQLVRSPADHHDHRQWYGKWPIPIPCR
jgi:rubredoxin